MTLHKKDCRRRVSSTHRDTRSSSRSEIRDSNAREERGVDHDTEKQRLGKKNDDYFALYKSGGSGSSVGGPGEGVEKELLGDKSSSIE